MRLPREAGRTSNHRLDLWIYKFSSELYPYPLWWEGCSLEAGVVKMGGGDRNKEAGSSWGLWETGKVFWAPLKASGCLSQQQKFSMGPIIHTTELSLKSAQRNCLQYDHMAMTRVCVCACGKAERQKETFWGDQEFPSMPLHLPPTRGGSCQHPALAPPLSFIRSSRCLRGLPMSLFSLAKQYVIIVVKIIVFLFLHL